ncbi:MULTISPECIES: hypothetical protein [unclassified Chromohalobacter]|uniref:hypothetical protein n=1 Tax=unclassified Chromohalobacter TaxID=2628571 RepID=UPI0024689A37|nr:MULTISPECIES: hypothetical protein [unclassified Chromohalobacter]
MDMQTASVTLTCADNTDEECKRYKSFDLRLLGLTDDQIRDIIDSNGRTRVALTPQQVEANDDTLTDYEKKQPLEEGLLLVDIDVEYTCGACGASY